MSVESVRMVVVVGDLRLPCFSTAKLSERTRKPWLRLSCLSRKRRVYEERRLYHTTGPCGQRVRL